MPSKAGIDCVLGYKAGGVGAVGDFVEMSNARNVNQAFTHGEADATTRAAQGWAVTEPTLKTGEITWEMVYDPADTNYTAVRTAWVNKALIGLALLDGPLTSGKGWVLDCKIFNFEQQEPNEGVVLVSVSAKVAYSADPPEYVTDGVNEA